MLNTSLMHILVSRRRATHKLTTLIMTFFGVRVVKTYCKSLAAFTKAASSEILKFFVFISLNHNKFILK